MSPDSAPAVPKSKRRWLLVGLVALGVSVLAVAGVAAAGTGAGWCGSCHAMRPFARGQAATAHKGIACGRCHASGPIGSSTLFARELGGMVPRYVLSFGGAEVSGPSSGVEDAGCRSCHADLADRVVVRAGLRIRHSSCVKPGQSCLDCHGGAAHAKAARAVRGASMDECLSCHDGTIASAKCDLCHKAKLPAERLARGPWSVTHGPNWQQTHGLGDVKTCKACHGEEYCRRCHGIDLPHDESFPRTHGATAVKTRTQCLKCHDEKTFCTSCHGIAMPHPATFLAGHSKIAKGFDDPACARCHPRDTCDACHVAHTHPGRTDGSIGKIALPEVKR